jgi:peptidoglycan-associated lipoprotein
MTVMISTFRTGAAALLACALVVSACGKKPPAVTPPPPAPAPTPAPTTPPTPPPPARPPDPTPTPTPPPEITLEELTKRFGRVLFSLDSIEITAEGRATIQKNAEIMKAQPSLKVLIEGHADSRGTNEYNLALAERRADAVRDYLVSLGVANDRVTIVSKGEEAPFCKEETEACWQQNRVGFFVATAK